MDITVTSNLITTPSTATLSVASATANGMAAYTGGVITDVGSGTLYWAVTENASPPAAAALKAWNAKRVTAPGAQAITGFGLSASTSYYVHYLHRANGQDSPVATSPAFTTTAPATVTRAQVELLAQDRRLCMPRWMVEGTAPRIVGADTLPPGVSYNGSEVHVSSGATVDLTGWDFNGATLKVDGRVNRFEDNLITQPVIPKSARPTYSKLYTILLDPQAGGPTAIHEMRRCWFDSLGNGFGPASTILGRHRSGVYPVLDLMEYCSFEGHQSDVMKSLWLGTQRFNYLDAGANISSDAVEWVPGTYNTGDVVYDTAAYYLRICTADGTTAAPDFSKKLAAQPPGWKNYDPHLDLETPFTWPTAGIKSWFGNFYNQDRTHKRLWGNDLGRGYVGAISARENSSNGNQPPLGHGEVTHCIFSIVNDNAFSNGNSVSISGNVASFLVENNWYDQALSDTPAAATVRNNVPGWVWPGAASLSNVAASWAGGQLGISFEADKAGFAKVVVSSSAALSQQQVHDAALGGNILAVLEGRDCIDCRAGQIGEGSVALTASGTAYVYVLYKSAGALSLDASQSVMVP